MNVQALTNFRNNVLRILADTSMTQRELSEKSKLTSVYINRILLGKVNPSLQVCEKIAGALGVPLAELISKNPKRILAASA